MWAFPPFGLFLSINEVDLWRNRWRLFKKTLFKTMEKALEKPCIHHSWGFVTWLWKYSIFPRARPWSLSTLRSPPSYCPLYQVATYILGLQQKGSLVKHIYIVCWHCCVFIDSCLLVGIASRNTPTSTVPTSPELGHTGAWDPEVVLQNKGISQHLTQGVHK